MVENELNEENVDKTDNGQLRTDNKSPFYL